MSTGFLPFLKSEFSIDTELVPFKIFFVFVYGGLSGIISFAALYYKQLGLLVHEIGLISGVRHACAIVVLPLIGPVADVKEYRKGLLVLFIALFVCCITPLGYIREPEGCCDRNDSAEVSVTPEYFDDDYTPYCFETEEEWAGTCCRLVSPDDQPLIGYIESDVARAFLIICFLNGLGDVCWMAIRIISDVSLAQALGNNSDRYGTSKVFGAIGGAAFALAAGYVVDQTTTTTDGPCGVHVQQTNYSYIFVANAVLMILAAFTVLFVKLGDGEEKASRRNWDIKGYISTLVNLKYVKLYVVTFLFGALKASSLNTFAYIYLSDVGGSNFLIGTAVSIGTVSGIFAGFSSSYLIRQFEHRLLYASFFTTACVMMMYSLLEVNWLVIIAALLQGVSPVIEWNVCVFIMRRIVVGNQGTVYSIMTLTSKIGKLISSVLAGYLYGAFGPIWLFRIFSLCSVLAIFIANLSMRSLSDLNREEDSDELGATNDDDQSEETRLIPTPVPSLPGVNVACDVHKVQPNDQQWIAMDG